MAEIRANQKIRRHLFVDEESFADLFHKDRFVDGIPLDELSRHLRKTKKYGKRKTKT
ncbi:hypothetical protein SAMN04487936_107114 [Halobacillus dabanensis]|uniref:Uncharacterized protein n=1 Tax=Halobacillus dabanensis TaxID=240302 RepID=A0A1I3WRZ5_HALDA|nr:hypothetical protein [Halobacillus dabanensis]SFK10252.1 hypothetical protein SAMN04487936_107114 [Halobacillus dabanensis]